MQNNTTYFDPILIASGTGDIVIPLDFFVVMDYFISNGDGRASIALSGMGPFHAKVIGFEFSLNLQTSNGFALIDLASPSVSSAPHQSNLRETRVNCICSVP